jgi:hypothetical protein
MKKKKLRNPSPTVTRIGVAELIVDELNPEQQQTGQQQEVQKLKDQADALQKIANLLNGKKP